MAAYSGITDSIQILKETTFADGGLAGEKVFGATKRFEWKAETSTTQTFGLETIGPTASNNHDGVLSYTGSHEFDFTDGRVFEAILGTIAQGTGTFSLSVANTLPSYSVKVVDEYGQNLIIKGLKYTKFALNLARGEEPVKITADWIAKTIENSSGTFTPTVPNIEPLMYLDGALVLSGTYQSDVEDITLEIDRKCQGRRFLEQTTAGTRRLITEIIEGTLTVAYNGNMTAQREVIKQVWGSSALTDTRIDGTLSIRMARPVTVSTGSYSALNLNVTGARHISTGRVLEKEAEVSMMDFAGIGISITGTGTYS
jgi:hypothetical protein